MAAEYMHIGIPVLNRKPGMVYNDWGKFWVNESVDEYDYKIEYLKFEEGTRFPELSCSPSSPTSPTRWTTPSPTSPRLTASSSGPRPWARTCASPSSSRTTP